MLRRASFLHSFVAGLTGMVVALAVGYILMREGAPLHDDHTHESSHPIGTSYTGKVHVHADFRMFVNGERIRFTADQYQSSPTTTHHATIHFHDGNDEVIHRHADGVTLAEFMKSIGQNLTSSCLTLDTGWEYCIDTNDALLLLVNGKEVTDVENYILAEEDRILLYYGEPKSEDLIQNASAVTDLACMYSGTCPERGTPPTEGCGLTCEVTDQTTKKSTWWPL